MSVYVEHFIRLDSNAVNQNVNTTHSGVNPVKATNVS